MDGNFGDAVELHFGPWLLVDMPDVPQKRWRKYWSRYSK